MASGRLPPTSPSPFTDRRAAVAAVTALSRMALTSLPPWGTSPASASPGGQADRDRHERHVIRLLPTRGHDASRAPSCPARIVASPLGTPAPDGWELLLDQADHPVVVATTAVDDAEAVALAVMEQ